MAKTRGAIEVLVDRCKGCDLCVAFCPPQVLRLSEVTNAIGYRYAEVYRDGCTGCEVCARICPDLAILVYRESRLKGVSA
jgi:2-oxoglutarate ferredoxin oxidoreductase subunit delta